MDNTPDITQDAGCKALMAERATILSQTDSPSRAAALREWAQRYEAYVAAWNAANLPPVQEPNDRPIWALVIVLALIISIYYLTHPEMVPL